MLLEQDTRGYQADFALYCRTGIATTIPGTRNDRLPVYHELIMNVLEDTLKSVYPITKTTLTQSEWENLVAHFSARGKLSSPELWRMPKALLEFAIQENYAAQLNRPYLIDLLAFEWLEMELYLMPDRLNCAVSKAGDLLNDELVLNPDHIFMDFNYPVFCMPAEDAAKHCGNFHLVGYRHRETLRVHFLEVSQLNSLFLNSLAIGRQSLKRFCATTPPDCADDLATFATAAIEQGLILGFNGDEHK